MIIELTWRNLKPELVFNDKIIELKSGENVSFELSKVRQCIGYKEFGEIGFTQCPAGSEIPIGTDSQCYHCKQKDVSFTAKTGFGSSEQAEKLLRSNHVVYLAYFSDHTIKVGVAVSVRKEVRVSEQGAVACLFIAEANGTAARNFERRIHNYAGFTEAVRIDSKLKIFGTKPDETKARTALLLAYDKIKNQVDSALLSNTPEFHYLFDRYGISEDVFATDMLNAKTVEPGARVSGRVAGVYGKIIMLEIIGKTYAINSQLLCGFDLNAPIDKVTPPRACGVTTKQVVIDRQQSLFSML